MEILIVTDSPYLFTGLGRINRELIKHLSSQGHDVKTACWGFDIMAYPKDDKNEWWYEYDEGVKIQVFPIQKRLDQFLIQMYEILKCISFDIVITIGDHVDLCALSNVKSKLNYDFKWVPYFTVESMPLLEEFKSHFNYMDKVLTTSKFGKDVIENETGIGCVHIPLGVDLDEFYVMPDNEVKILREKKSLEGKFRLINVCKNQARKNIPAFMEALKILHDEDERFVGYLHTNENRKGYSGYDIRGLIKRFGLEGVLELPEKKIQHDMAVSDAILREEYNCSDAFVMTSVCEGFGLPLIESQACGLIPIGTNYSSIPELIGPYGETVDYQRYFAPMDQEVAIVNIFDLVGKIKKVFHQEDRIKKKKECSEFAKGYDWQKMNMAVENEVKRLGTKKRVPLEVLI